MPASQVRNIYSETETCDEENGHSFDRYEETCVALSFLLSVKEELFVFCA